MFYKNKIQLGCILLGVILFNLEIIAQTQSRVMSDIFIAENNFVSIFGEHNFVEGGSIISPGMISTAKTGERGLIIFAQGSSWKGASEAQFVDGYVQVYHDDPFVFPVGANGKYRPVAISGASLTSVAFFDKNPAKITKGAITASRASASKETTSLEKISDAEFWIIEGEKPTHLTLFWGRDSNIDELTQGDLKKLSIIGWKNGQWNVISSSFDIQSMNNRTHANLPSTNLSNVSIGSITTSEEIIPSDYDYFTFGSLSTANLIGSTNFIMYPNPRLTKMPLNIRYQFPNEEGGTLRITSVNGSMLLERIISDEYGVITLSNITNNVGAYNVSITNKEGEMLSKKLIVVAE